MSQETVYAPSTPIRDWAGGLLILNGIMHGIVTPEYLSGWWGYGAFFLVAGIAQVIFGAIIIMQPWRYDEHGHLRTHPENYAIPVYLVGIIGVAALIILYVITRTVGIPFFGPEAGEIKAVTPISLISKGLEVAIIVLMVMLMLQALRTKSS